MGNELVPIEMRFEAEKQDASYEPYIDVTYDEFVDVLPADEVAAVATSLDEADEEALEMGIASVFDELRAEFEEPTFTLLAELNRIWAEPLAA